MLEKNNYENYVDYFNRIIKAKKWQLFILVLIFIVSFFAFINNLESSQLKYDAARSGSVAREMIKTNKIIFDDGSGYYDSPLHVFFLIPGLFFFGNTLFGLGFFHALIYCLLVIGIILLSLELYDDLNIGLLASGMFISSKFIIWFSKFVWGSSLTPLSTILFLLSFFRFRRLGKSKDLVLFFCSISFGIAMKQTFVYFVMASFFSGLLLYNKELSSIFKKIINLKLKTYILITFLFFLFQIPFFIKSYILNLSSSFDYYYTTITTFLSSNILEHILFRISQLIIFPIISLVGCFIVFIFDKNNHNRFMIFTIVLIIPFLTLVPNTMHNYHYIIIVPIPFLITAFLLNKIITKINVKKVLCISLSVIILCLISVQNVNQVYSEFEENSKYVKEFSHYLDSAKSNSVFTSNLLVHNMIQFLYYGRFEKNGPDFYSYEVFENNLKLQTYIIPILNKALEDKNIKYIIISKLDDYDIVGREVEKIFEFMINESNLSLEKTEFYRDITAYKKV